MDPAIATRAARRPLHDTARLARRGAVLREASAQFRRSGVAAADLAVIAQAVGLSRASLYNYCSGRADLARRCYLDALQVATAPLRDPRPALTGLQQVVAFVGAATGKDHPLAAIAAELDLLPADVRQEIRSHQDEAVDLLAARILAGQDDGSIRPCDAALAARTIWGLVFWTPVGELWAGRDGEDLTVRIAGQLPALVERGIVTDRGRSRPASVAAPLLDRVIEGRPRDRTEEIARTASCLFNRRGVDGVSLEEVAAAMGATKGLVYHQFESKAALVRHACERGIQIYEQILGIAEEAADGLEQSRRGLTLNGMAQLRDLHPMSLNAPIRWLSVEDQAHFARRVGALLERSVAMAERGMREGLHRDFDATAVSLVSAGTFLFLARLLPDVDPDDDARIAGGACDVLLYGLAVY